MAAALSYQLGIAEQGFTTNLPLADLDQRGMLDTTLVLMLGEFGRTPRFNGATRSKRLMSFEKPAYCGDDNVSCPLPICRP